jgi:hypothetical protein
MGYNDVIKPIPTPARESVLRSAAPAAQSSALRNPAYAPLKGRELQRGTPLFIG